MGCKGDSCQPVSFPKTRNIPTHNACQLQCFTYIQSTSIGLQTIQNSFMDNTYQESKFTFHTKSTDKAQTMLIATEGRSEATIRGKLLILSEKLILQHAANEAHHQTPLHGT